MNPLVVAKYQKTGLTVTVQTRMKTRNVFLLLFLTGVVTGLMASRR